MVKPQFCDVNVECWLHRERLGRTQKSICLSHDSLKDGIILLEAFDELLAEEPPAQRIVRFRGTTRPKSYSSLRLRLVPKSEELQVFHVSREEDTALIEMTAVGLPLIRAGIVTWCAGGEDFGVSVEHADLPKKQLGGRDIASMELWFWGPVYSP
jgi:hypothetical protein